MAFDILKFARTSAGVTSGNSTQYHSYLDGATDTLASIKGSDFFANAPEIRAGDIIHVVGSDGYDDLRVVSLNPVVTQQYATTASSVFKTIHTTTGGSSVETVTATGVKIGDIPLVTINTDGASPVTITKASITSNDAISITCSADPSTDHKFNIVAYRP